MVAVDTNVLVRLLTRDDEGQFEKSVDFFREQTIFIPNTVVLETEWVLRYAYQFTPNQIIQGLQALFGLASVHLSNASLLDQALQWYGQGLDFADALHLASSQQCSHLWTFDKKFAKRSQGLSSCEVNVL